MTKKRVVHYINQFYAGMGGEDTASVGLSERDGAVGPGAALALALGDDYEIVKTIICATTPSRSIRKKSSRRS